MDNIKGPGCLSEVFSRDFYEEVVIPAIENRVSDHGILLHDLCTQNHVWITNYMAKHFCELEDMIIDRKLTKEEAIQEIGIFADEYVLQFIGRVYDITKDYNQETKEASSLRKESLPAQE